MRFADQAAIVTGASSGIGRVTALRLAAEGASLCLVAAPTDNEDLEATLGELEAKGCRAIGLAADVGEESTALVAVRLARAEFGGIDLLVDNAGITYFDEIFEAPTAHFDHTIKVNVRGMYLMAVESARAMARGRGGSIVCTASTTSWMGEEYQVAYHVSKGAVLQMVRSLAVDLAPYGVRVNGIAPGSVLTPVVKEIVERPREWAKFRTRIPMDRAADPEEIAAPIAFLLSEEASYITGTVLIADGGLTAGYRMSDWDAEIPSNTVRPRKILGYGETLGEDGGDG